MLYAQPGSLAAFFFSDFRFRRAALGRLFPFSLHTLVYNDLQLYFALFVVVVVLRLRS